MSTLQEKINEDLTSALKQRETDRYETLRLLIAAIHNRVIEKRTKSGSDKLTDEEVLEIVKREVKKRKEAIEFYDKAGRDDRSNREKIEISVISVYLPTELDIDQIKKVVREIVSPLGGLSDKDFGRVMGLVMKQLKGKADAQVVGGVVKEMISGGV
ncbi:GatB/YqeY domain-containing protein [Candidatus Jorgensenbacteria bacterium]|nr:GatB/YqeY domain-containing protein [Candidatus Jorgensenbacteria bacterium]